MKELKVKPIFGGHQIYQEIVNYPPRGVKYIGVSNGTKSGKYYESKKIKEKLGSILQKLKLPRMIYVRPGNYDIIHSSRGIIPLNRKPWVIDMEHVHSFFGLNPNLIKNKFWKKFIEKKLASKNCKAILCHCEATRQAFFRYLDCSKFKEKLKVLYPSSHLTSFGKNYHKNIRILAILSLFEHKGGLQILDAFSRLEKKYKNIELWVKADVPLELKKKYNSNNIKYFSFHDDILPRENLIKKFHTQCDIFVYPTFCDSFGYSLIDAMVAKLPIISTNMFAVPEIVENGKNGFIINIPGYSLKDNFLQYHSHKNLTKKDNKKFVNDMVESLDKLLKNKRLRDKMSKESFRMVSKGKFSIRERNKKLLEVYKIKND